MQISASLPGYTGIQPQVNTAASSGSNNLQGMSFRQKKEAFYHTLGLNNNDLENLKAEGKKNKQSLDEVIADKYLQIDDEFYQDLKAKTGAGSGVTANDLFAKAMDSSLPLDERAAYFMRAVAKTNIAKKVMDGFKKIKESFAKQSEDDKAAQEKLEADIAEKKARIDSGLGEESE
jgi:hypothetical protein